MANPVRARVVALRKEGHTYSEIAALLGITKNAAVGHGRRGGAPIGASVLNRPGWNSNLNRPAKGAAPRIRRADRETLPPLPTAATSILITPPPKKEPAMIAPSPAQIPLPVPVTNVVRLPERPVSSFYKCCQWPLNDGPRWRFCDALDVEPGRPYCLTHCREAYQGYVPFRLRAVNDAAD